MRAGPRTGGCLRQPARRKIQHHAKRFERLEALQKACKGPAEVCRLQREVETARIGQRDGKDAACQPVPERALVGGFDMHARMVDEMHVVDAGGTGGRAGEAGEAAIDMGHHRASAGRSFSSMSLMR